MTKALLVINTLLLIFLIVRIISFQERYDEEIKKLFDISYQVEIVDRNVDLLHSDNSILLHNLSRLIKQEEQPPF